MKPLFSKIVKCGICGKNHRAKMQRKKRFYICSTYNNYGKCKCKRLPISEELIIGLLEMRIDEEIADVTINKYVDNIIVYPDQLIINIKNEEPIILKDNLLQVVDLGQHVNRIWNR